MRREVSGRLRRRRGADAPADRPRIFNVGFNKTGTSSFHRAMEILGFQSLHWGGPRVHELVQTSFAAKEPLLTRLDPRYDAFSDIGPLSRRFPLLDEQYPGSHFILTVRPVEEWLDSRRRHVEYNRDRQALGAYRGDFLEVDEKRWREDWEDHVQRVRSYFDGRRDFLEIDLTRNPSWEPLCELLGRPIPTVAFPWDNLAREPSSFPIMRHPTAAFARLWRSSGAMSRRVRGASRILARGEEKPDHR